MKGKLLTLAYIAGVIYGLIMIISKLFFEK